ncbi:MAG: HAD family phosphatase, partial [Rhizobiales bacterium]|nr:HAD family phosphatase [Hyphomicrobiales bacterium]
MKNIDLIIFDFDGVIVDSEYLYKKANIIALKQAYIDIPDDDLNHKFWGLSYTDILNMLRNEFGAARTDMFDDIIQPIARKMFEDELEAIPHVIDFIEASPHEFCIGSNSRTSNEEPRRKQRGIRTLRAACLRVAVNI